MIDKVDFSTGERTQEFLLTLHEVFPLIEHFLECDEYADIVFFLSEKKVDMQELCQIRDAIENVERKLGRYYPSFMPPKPKPSNRYTFEGVLAVAVFNLTQMLTHLGGLADDFIVLLEHGQDPSCV
jgi:hypothetical protein